MILNIKNLISEIIEVCIFHRVVRKNTNWHNSPNPPVFALKHISFGVLLERILQGHFEDMMENDTVSIDICVIKKN